jgi:cereblon
MCGVLEITERDAASIEYGESSCMEVGKSYGTVEQYREAANRRLERDDDSEEAAEVYSEGETVPREGFSGHHQGEGNVEAREALTFDTNLASMHTYLGGLGEVEDVSSDRFSGLCGTVLKLPMFYLEGIVLFPGQKLPLRVLQQRFKAAVHHAMDPVANDAVQTLGVIHVRVSPNGNIHVANYGTTAKIKRASEQRDGSLNVMTTGGQRFRILSVWTQPDGALFAQVQTIEEDTNTQRDFSRHLNSAFGSVASTVNRRNSRDKQSSSAFLPRWNDGQTPSSNFDEFVEEPEDGEQYVQHREGNNEADQVLNEDSDAEDGGLDEERTGGQYGDEAEAFFDAVAEEDEQRSSDEYDDGSGPHDGRPQDEDNNDEDSYDGRPRVRQRLNTGSSIGRRLEAVQREPTEGRNRKEGELLEVSQSTEQPQSLDEKRKGKERASEEEQPAHDREDTVAKILPVSVVRGQRGPYANAYQMWRKDTSRWNTRAQLTALPHWVYRQYDTYDLARRAADMMGKMGDHPRLEELVSDPTRLSYYIGSNMPIQDHTRQDLLEIDSTLVRLKREIQLLEGMDTLRCNGCGEVIARRSDVFVMSTEGAIGAYVNAHGYVHETLTLSCARNMRIRGAPQTENSWFPGYAWILAKCQGCHLIRREQHMGWRFVAVDPDTRPQTFWGIRRTQLIGSSEAQPPDHLD